MFSEFHEAYLNGWVAHRVKGNSGENPYDPQTQKFSYRQWDTGWSERFDACKHGGDLSLDAKLEQEGVW